MKTFLILIVVMLARVALAEPYTPSPMFAKAPGLPAGYDEATAIRLDLARALQIAMEQNIGMSIERHQVDAVDDQEVIAKWSLYEPGVSAGFQHSKSVTPPMTRQAGAAGEIITSVGDTWSAGVSQHLPTGATVTAGVSIDRYASSSGTAVLPDYYTSGATVTLTQPLFRGFSRDLVIPQMSVLTAKIATESERHNIELVAAGVVQQTESAYWNVVSALYAYRVAVEARQSAADTLALMRRQIEAGMTASTDVAQSEAAAAAQDVAVLDRAAEVETAWDALRVVLNLPRDQWQRPILPTDLPAFDGTPSPSVEDAIAIAMQHRPEVAMMALEDKSAELAQRKAQNDRLPQIDLQLGASVSGLGTSASEAVNELGGSTTSWNIGVALSWTPLQKVNNANRELMTVQTEVRDAQHGQRVQQIAMDVRSAVRARGAAATQVQAAQRSRELAQAAFAAENKKYLAGTSSSTALTVQQQALTSAEQQELAALVNSERANTQLLLATGQLLAARHVVLAVGR